MNVLEVRLLVSSQRKSGPLRTAGRALLGGLVLVTAWYGGAIARAGSRPTLSAIEPAMRAAFVYHLTKFVEWPATASPVQNPVLRVGVWGDPAAVPSLIALLQGKTIAGRQAVVVAARRPEELADCQVVFISTRQGEDVSEALEYGTRRGTLTIGEGTDDVAPGVIVSFEVREDRIHFAVNREAAGRAGLRVSSHLLKLASHVDTRTEARSN